MSKKRRRAKRLIERANKSIQNIPQNNINLGIPINRIKKKPEMESWPDLKEIYL